MSAIHDELAYLEPPNPEPTGYELSRLEAALGENFTAEPIGDGWVIDCSGCGIHVVDDIDEAIALAEAHRKFHDQEARP